jgi:hypothetical protein
LEIALGFPVALSIFAGRFGHLLAAQQDRLRTRSLRAFVHLQRILAVDAEEHFVKLFS